MRQHFIDTSAFIAQVLVSDQYHQQAMVVAQALRHENSLGVTTGAILSELLIFLQRKVGHHASIQSYESIVESSCLTVIYLEQKEFESAMEIYKQPNSRDFSFVDCVSFAVMKREKITHAFTFDEHFAQAGFEIIKAT